MLLRHGPHGTPIGCRIWHGNVLDDAKHWRLFRIRNSRHSYSSRALALGESMAATAALLGHRKIATTARYAHLTRNAEKLAIAKIGRSIGADLGVGTQADPLDAGSR